MTFEIRLQDHTMQHIFTEHGKYAGYYVNGVLTDNNTIKKGIVLTDKLREKLLYAGFKYVG